MRKLLGVAFIIALLSGCTPAQHQFWVNWLREDPVAAKPELEKAISAEHQKPRNQAPSWSNCPQWFDEFLDAGFSASQWGQFDHIMYRESRCIATARNPSGASGLVQIMPMWAGPCGVTRYALLIGSVNLRCARYILEHQGMGAWALTRG